MITRPRAKQPAAPERVPRAQLTTAHFERHPIWASVLQTDAGEPWYRERDGLLDTFRPWTGPTPIEGLAALVSATAVLADGTRLAGCMSAGNPQGRPPIEALQPHLFLPDGRLVALYWQHFPLPDARLRKRIYRALGRTPDEVFPIGFTARRGLSKGLQRVTVEGFTRSEVIERVDWRW